MKNIITCSGALFYSKESQKVLFLLKNTGKNKGTWGIVGGMTNKDENPWQGLTREIVEEIGFLPNILKSIPLETFVSNDAIFNFHTFLCVTDKEFIPIMSNEHSGYAWTTLDYYPKPLHQGLRSSLSNKNIQTKLQTVLNLIQLI